jgi:DNA-damage-inducible protein D
MEHSSPNFDSIKQTNPYGQEYWSARDLAPLLGYNKWQRFEDAIQRAMIACEQSGNIVADHFTGAGKMVKLGSKAEREVTDYFLSRFSCYLIAQNGDPRKPEIAAAQVYFAVSTRAFEIHQLRKQQEERLETRLQVAEGNKKLAEAAQNAGVQSENFGIFNDAGYVGLYTKTSEEIRVHKNIPEGAEILDHMGREELAANLFRITQTEGKLVREDVQGEDDAINTHHVVGREIRKTIEALKGPLPEDLPSAPSIRKMVEERRRASKKLRLEAAKKKKADNSRDTLF